MSAASASVHQLHRQTAQRRVERFLWNHSTSLQNVNVKMLLTNGCRKASIISVNDVIASGSEEIPQQSRWLWSLSSALFLCCFSTWCFYFVLIHSWAAVQSLTRSSTMKRINRWQTGDESWKTRGQFHPAWCPELRIKYAVFVESSRNGRGLFKSRENTFMIGIPCWIKSSVFKLMVIMIDIHLVTQWFYVMTLIVLSILNILLNCWSIVDVAFKWIWCGHEIFMWKFWDELHTMQIALYILQFIHTIPVLTKGGTV